MAPDSTPRCHPITRPGPAGPDLTSLLTSARSPHGAAKTSTGQGHEWRRTDASPQPISCATVQGDTGSSLRPGSSRRPPSDDEVARASSSAAAGRSRPAARHYPTDQAPREFSSDRKQVDQRAGHSLPKPHHSRRSRSPPPRVRSKPPCSHDPPRPLAQTLSPGLAPHDLIQFSDQLDTGSDSSSNSRQEFGTLVSISFPVF